MAIYKCKMCGGTLEVHPGDSVAVCDSCGSKQTLPKLDDERRINMFERANYFRCNGDFDKADGIFESIIAEDNTDAEAYWSLVLCKYGISYVEDPISHRRIPTINRAQYASVQSDENYLSAIKYADGYQKDIYEEEAKAIDAIQKQILAISQKEEPFDIFICYKDTDNAGERTKDSVIAQDIYNALINEKFKVFFSRITLEGKLGSEYEPYIFAALNSAKVMLVVGTSKENLESVWVKNEWSRYLALIKNNYNKILIPVYAEMNPYDMPDELSNLMAQDVNKIGFMQDLIHGIKKVCHETKQVSNVAKSDKTDIVPLLKRINMFLEDGDWESADDYCERVLDIDPENVQAYLGKLLARLKVHEKGQIRYCSVSLDDDNNYKKILKYGDEELKSELIEYNSYINKCNEEIRVENEYLQAKEEYENSDDEYVLLDASRRLFKLPDYKDAKELAKKCEEKAIVCHKNSVYNMATEKMQGDYLEDIEQAIELFSEIDGWKDSSEHLCTCKKVVEDFNDSQLRKTRLASAARITIVIATAATIILELLTAILSIANQTTASGNKVIYLFVILICAGIDVVILINSIKNVFNSMVQLFIKIRTILWGIIGLIVACTVQPLLGICIIIINVLLLLYYSYGKNSYN